MNDLLDWRRRKHLKYELIHIIESRNHSWIPIVKDRS